MNRQRAAKPKQTGDFPFPKTNHRGKAFHWVLIVPSPSNKHSNMVGICHFDWLRIIDLKINDI